MPVTGTCFHCQRSNQQLNKADLCPPCTTLWLSITPEQRRTWLQVVVPS